VKVSSPVAVEAIPKEKFFFVMLGRPALLFCCVQSYIGVRGTIMLATSV
jgi:hypothetical protein